MRLAIEINRSLSHGPSIKMSSLGRDRAHQCGTKTCLVYVKINKRSLSAREPCQMERRRRARTLASDGTLEQHQ